MKQVVAIPLDKVQPYYGQPREDFAQDRLEELGESLREHGQQTPVVVRRLLELGDTYELIDGERRWRALKLISASHVQALVSDVGGDDDQFVKAVVSNCAREDLSPAEAARAVNRIALMPAFKELSNAERNRKLAAVFGHSTAWISNMLSIAGLAPAVQTLLEEKKLGVEVALELAPVPSQERQVELAERVSRHGFRSGTAKNIVRESVRVERLREGMLEAKHPTTTGRAQSTDVRVVNELVSRIHEAAESVLDMPAKRLAEAYRAKPAECDRAIARVDAAVLALEQLRGALNKLASADAARGAP